MIAVLDYGIGNLASACKAFAAIGEEARLVSSARDMVGARGVVLPGVGSFGRCAEAIRKAGMDEVVSQAVEAGVPFLGICVGFQLLYSSSQESPGVPGLGLLPGQVVALPDHVKRPQMQWNLLERTPDAESGMLAGLGEHPWMYFVHSYYPFPDGFETSDQKVRGGVTATCSYGAKVVAAVEQGELWGVQFHPEKSGAAGLAVLRNFAERCRQTRSW